MMIPALRTTARRIALLTFFPIAAAPALQVTPPPRPAPRPATPAPQPRPERAPRPPVWDPVTPLPSLFDRPLEMPEPWPAPLPDLHDLEWKLEGLGPRLEHMKTWELDTKLHALEDARLHLENLELTVPTVPHFMVPPTVEPLMPVEPLTMGPTWVDPVTPMPFRWRVEAPFATRPPAPWAQGDPADSLYKLARELVNRGEWRRAASAFSDIPQRFPNSAYAPQALYWQAFSLYRIGSTDDLQNAVRALEALRAKYPSSSRTRDDASALMTRIQGTLAARGDRRAEDALRAELQNGQQSCDKEDLQVRAEAMTALARTDPSSIVPMTRRVLARKERCLAPLRSTAVHILGRSGDNEAPAILRDVALNDPETEVRTAAINWLARSPSDVAVNTLEEILRNSTDQTVLRYAARGLATSPNARAKQAVRALIERNDAPERLRMDAISGFENGERTTEDDAAYLRSIYNKVDNPRIKARIARVLGQLGGTTNDQWLIGLMRNNDEPVEVRRAALERVASRNMPIAEAVKLYGAVADRQLREQLISVYRRREEPEATDKLIDIAKNDTDYNLRRQAISALTAKKDPRATKLLLEIIDK